MIVAAGILAGVIEIYGFLRGRTTDDELAEVAGENISGTVQASTQQTVIGPQTNIAGDVQGPVLSGQFDGPVATEAGAEAADFRGSTGAMYKPTIQQHERHPVPSQIPARPKDFTGRKDEIDALLNNFQSGATITGLRGLGGVGKTALALVLAERLKDGFPDGQIFINLLGTSKNPLDVAEAMVHVIRSFLGADARLPDDPDGRAGLYQSVLSGKKALLLLDNAADREQVEPLLPPSGCAAIVTSRNKFTLPGLKGKDLDVLPLEDAKKLLLEIAERIGGRAGDLARLCGCLPIALRNAAYALAERRDLGVAEYLQRLQEARNRVELVEASFSLSYDLLSPELQRLWCMLSIFPADFDRAGATAVWEMDLDSAARSLSDLVKWSLVEFDPAGERYRLHDLARDYAGSRLQAGEKAEAEQRHAGHYQGVLWKANDLLLQGGESMRAGLDFFDSEWPNIQAGQIWAEKNMAKSPEIAEICSNYAWAGSILNLRLNPRESVRWLQAALVAARQIKNRDAEGAHLGNLGLAYADLGETRKAIEYYQQRLAIAREIGDRRGEGNALGNMGSAYYSLGDARKAIEYYEKILIIHREIGDRRGEGADLGNLGLAYAALGDARKAIEYYQQALAIAREIGDRRGEGADLGNLGSAYYSLGDARKALNYYEQQLAITQEIGDRRGEGACLGNLGTAYADLGDARKAIEYYQQRLAIAREIGDRRGEANACWNLGLAYEKEGDLQRAVDLMQVCVDLEREIEHPDAEKDANYLEGARARLKKL